MSAMVVFRCVCFYKYENDDAYAFKAFVWAPVFPRKIEALLSWWKLRFLSRKLSGAKPYIGMHSLEEGGGF